jgi:hypothetical protein
LLFFISSGDVDHQKSFEPCSHFLAFTEGVEAHNQVEADVVVRSVVHDIFVDLNGFSKALLLDECKGDITLDSELHLLVLVGGAVEGHVVHLDGLVKLFLLKVDVSHVDAQTGCLGVLFVLKDNCVAVKGLCMESVSMVHVCQVVKNVEGQVDVDLIKGALGFTELANLFFFRGSFFSFCESVIQVLFYLKGGRQFEKAMNLFFNLFEVFLFTLLLLFLDDGGLLAGEYTFLDGFRFESSGSVRFHGGTETLLGGADGLTAGSNGTALVTTGWGFGLREISREKLLTETPLKS